MEIEVLLRPRNEPGENWDGEDARAHVSVLVNRIVERDNYWFNQAGDKQMHSTVHMDKTAASAVAELGIHAVEVDDGSKLGDG